MRKSIIILSVFTLIASSCGQTGTKPITMPSQSYVGLWHTDDNPPNDLTILEIGSVIKFEFGIYRLIGANGTAKIENNEIVFVTDADFGGTMKFSENGILLTVDKSDFQYIEVGETFNFIIKKESSPENLYADIPDSMFPIPILNGVVIPYDRFSPGEEGYEVTSYIYAGANFMESYKDQLRNAGFIDNGSTELIESLWRYDRSEDGATLMVEMFHEGDLFVINMYVNYLKTDLNGA